MPPLPSCSIGLRFQENPKQLFVWGGSGIAQRASKAVHTLNQGSGDSLPSPPSPVGIQPWARLTFVVGHHFLQGAKGAPWGDIEAPIIQGPDLIMLHCIPMLGVVVSHGQRVAPCVGQRKTAQARDLRGLLPFVSTLTPLPDTPIKPPLAPS